MPDLLDREIRTALRVDGDERLARAELRRQIGRLEAQLGALFADAFPRVEIDAGVDAIASEPRALGLGDLEAVRDSLATRIGDARRRLQERAELETRNRELLERMLAAPAEHKWLRDLPRRRRRARLRRLAFPPSPRPAGHADGLVAGQGLLRMPVIRTACGR